MRRVLWHVLLAAALAACGTSDGKGLVTRAEALATKAESCTTLACAKAAQMQTQKLMGRARGLDSAAAQALFAATARVDRMVEKLALTPALPGLRQQPEVPRTPALTRAEIWNTVDAACTVAFVDATSAPARTTAMAGLARVGLTLPADPASTAEARRAWHGDVAFAFLKALGKTTATPNDVMVFAMVQHNICVLLHSYEPKQPYFTRLTEIMEVNAKETGITETVAPVLTLLKQQAPAPAMHAAVVTLQQQIAAAMQEAR